MSYLSTALTESLQNLSISQTELAKRAAITQAQANRACRGSVAVGADTIHAIARALPEEMRGDVVAAWLKDQIEPDLQNFVLIMSTVAKIEESPGTILPDGLSGEQKELVSWVANTIIRQTAVFDMLRGLREISEPTGRK